MIDFEYMKMDLTKLDKNKNKLWVAISPKTNKVVGQASTIEKVLLAANKAKEKNPTVFKIGPFSNLFSLS